MSRPAFSSNFKQFLRHLEKSSVQRKLFSYKGPLRKAAALWRRSRRSLFKDRGFIFEDIEKETKKDKRSEGFRPYPILVRSKKLKKSIVGKGPDNFLLVGKRFVRMGTKLIYGRFLQGQRPFVFIGKHSGSTPETLETDLKKIPDIILKAAVKKMDDNVVKFANTLKL